jgi:hypothetical protein
MLVVGGGGGGVVLHFTEVFLSGGKRTPIQNLTACFTEANFIHLHFSHSWRAKKNEDLIKSHVIKCL